MTRYSAPQVKKKKRGTKAFLPIIGIILAVLFAFVAYFAAPPLVEALEGLEFRGKTVDTQFDELRVKYGENIINYIFTALIWLVCLGISVFLVSLAVGDDPEKEAFKYMGPPPADKKAMAKYYKRELKERQKRAKQKQSQLKKK